MSVCRISSSAPFVDIKPDEQPTYRCPLSSRLSLSPPLAQEQLLFERSAHLVVQFDQTMTPVGGTSSSTPAHSRCQTHPEGFTYFVTSIAAPVASG
jgi:hypothetical protein